MMTTTLQAFVQSLDPKTLPRVLHIQSGFYHGGSHYELSGNECSLSTGDVIKITELKVKKVIATYNEYSKLPAAEFPPDFPGLFSVMADKNPYHSIEEIVQALPIGPFGNPNLYSDSEIHIADITIDKGKTIIFNSVEEINGVKSIICKVTIEGTDHSFSLPLSHTGKFYECQDERIYTLKEIVDWKIPKNRARTVILKDIIGNCTSQKLCYSAFIKGMMVVKPVYELKVLTQYGEFFNLASDLDVEVLDITQHCDLTLFTQILTTQDIFEKTTNEFPLIVEILEGPLKHCKSYKALRCGRRIIVHKKYQADRIIASESRSDTPKRHFLIPSSYTGKFKRRPRFFPTVFDLNIAKREITDLYVVATKSFHTVHTEFSSLNVGDMLQVKMFKSCEVLCEGLKTIIDTLECIKTNDGNSVKVILPLYVEGGFMEIVHDSKQYSLSELCNHFQLPLNVKVSVRDLFTVGEDILANTSVLKLEEHITDSYLLVSLYDKPEDVWELPVFRLKMSFLVISNFKGKVFSLPTKTNIEEINEEEYYMVRRYENHVQLPPPRPPKTPTYISKSGPNIAKQMLPKDENAEETLQLENRQKDSLQACNELSTSSTTTLKDTFQ
ncbi:protein THEMIS isoform X2 [Bufo gargarizans]|uniref:protein THEMIS isoform X2 n=1 Tax=Bufo gargarizans TaxID=30331 RepID=UPI001CF4ACC8|nr:protein THEMIS isoform X2 [Bufo gargarizans]